MKSATQKRKLLTKKQQEFEKFVGEKVMPLLALRDYNFDMINPPLYMDEWYGKNILVTIPYGEKMEPWLTRVISECYAYTDKTIVVVMGAKINTNAWHKFVFPIAEEISFVRKGKRPTAFVVYINGLRNHAFTNEEDSNIFSTATYVSNEKYDFTDLYNWDENDEVESEENAE